MGTGKEKRDGHRGEGDAIMPSWWDWKVWLFILFEGSLIVTMAAYLGITYRQIRHLRSELEKEQELTNLLREKQSERQKGLS